MSLVEIAIEIQENEEKTTFLELYNKVCEKKGFNEEEKRAHIAQFYTDITACGDFIYCGDDLWDLKRNQKLDALEKEFLDVDVPIKGAVNLKARPISEFSVRLAYGELTLIIAMIRDYIKEMDNRKENGTLGINPVEYEYYYRPKFLAMAERISQQINYDYDAQVEKCRKKMLFFSKD